MISVENYYTFLRFQTDFSGYLKEGMLFFDIETTGLSASGCQIYCIGAGWAEDGGVHILQLMSDRIDDEPELLSAFSGLCLSFSHLVTFNGTMFDLPFVRTRCKKAGLPDPFEGMEILDLYKELRPVKHLLRLENYKQKTVEQFLDLARDDTMNGGELIPYYFLYVKYHRQEDLDLLLIHNLEDVKGMFDLLSVLSYCSLPETDLTLEEIRHFRDESRLELELSRKDPVPVPVKKTAFCGTLALAGDRVSLQLPVTEGPLRHYFKDYKNYYYLPAEQTVVHKSVGIYVDADHREPASRENCYLEQNCAYLTLPCASAFDFFRKDLKDRWSYLDLADYWTEDGRFTDDPDLRETFLRYIRLVLCNIISEKS